MKLTKEDTLRIWAKYGIEPAPPDHPIYSEPASVAFIPAAKRSQRSRDEPAPILATEIVRREGIDHE